MSRFMFGWCSRLGAAVALVVMAACGDQGETFYQIDVNINGDGSGTVEATDAALDDLDCTIVAGTESSGCDYNFDDAGGGGNFNLVAIPDPGTDFLSWSGCTAVSGATCQLSFSQAARDTAFNVYVTFGVLPSGFGTNLLANPGFEASDVNVGGLPGAAGNWSGDLANRVASDLGVAQRTGGFMLKFGASGLVAGTGFFTSQQWQTVNLSAYAADIDAGGVRLDASMWVNRVAGDAETDTRFDLRVLAFPGAPAGFPADYPPPSGQIRSVTINSTAGSWQQLQVQFDVLPVGTRYVAVEIYPYEDVVDDGAIPEFDGHYADDVSLVLTRLP